jgi:photosystem II stability/assembly factor-like uncharacterized protein
LIAFLVAIAGTPIASGGETSQQQGAKAYDQSLFKALRWRPIRPYRGGRVTAVAGVTSQPHVYYFGATGGGVWKTTDGGANWERISDGYFKTGSVGAIAVAESDPNIVYVGMGESPIRGNFSQGDGIYKSTDAGKTWKHIGLDDTRQIGRVRIHPRNPDIVHVAALGHVFGTNAERGVLRTEVYRELASKMDAQLERLDRILREDLKAFNNMAREREIPAVMVRNQ